MSTNWVAGGLLAFTIFFYAVPYTMWLKRRTSQNIVIGGAAGAFPPMIGWAAVTGGIGIESVVLFAIIFMWTPPHFWALALAKNADYTRAGVPMLPVTAGETETRRQILVYTLLLAPLGVLPVLMGFASLLYLAMAVAGGGWMLWLAIEIWRKREGKSAIKACWAMFGFSILYLFALFAALLVEKLALRLGFVI
jgi:protoheme IX farnesyltransferase